MSAVGTSEFWFAVFLFMLYGNLSFFLLIRKESKGIGIIFIFRLKTTGNIHL